LIKHFDQKTGCPVIINTSFNVRGEPIVMSPEHAYRCFMATNIDVLVIDRFLLRREDQPQHAKVDSDAHLKQFQLD
jgi:carbamoyltransferase